MSDTLTVLIPANATAKQVKDIAKSLVGRGAVNLNNVIPEPSFPKANATAALIRGESAWSAKWQSAGKTFTRGALIPSYLRSSTIRKPLPAAEETALLEWLARVSPFTLPVAAAA